MDASSNRVCVICGYPPEAHDGKIVQHNFEDVIPNSAAEWRGPAEEAPGFQYEIDANDDRAAELGHKLGSPSVGRDTLDPRYGPVTPNSVAEIRADERRRIADEIEQLEPRYPNLVSRAAIRGLLRG